MNIEDILPELFGEKRVYYCQRCLNHGLHEKRKNHKQTCLYRFCQCNDCQLVDRRRELNTRLLSMDAAESSEGSSHDLVPESPPQALEERKIKERRPNCQRCAQHNVVNRLKGHKRACPFKDCFCAKCQVVVERQKLMADQIKLRRRQKREKALLTMKVQDEQQSLEISTNDTEVCAKCTQQAFSYQQLMSLLEPMSPVDPLLTLSTILQACPHKQFESPLNLSQTVELK